MNDMNKAIVNLANSMTADYALRRVECDVDSVATAVQDDMLAEYEENLDFRFGRKYIKVLTGRTCAGFIVNTNNDPEFERGDMLMASYNSPARSFARGNIFNDDDVTKVRWYGIV